MRRLALVLLLIGVTGTAHAERSRRTAQILSGSGTAVSGVLILSGFMFAKDGYPINKPLMYTGLVSAAFTPSLGEIYAGQYLTIGMGARVLGAGIATFALTNYMATATCDNASMAGTQCTNIQGPGLALLGLAAIAFIGGMAYDVDDAGPAADRYNARLGIMVAPTAVTTPTGASPGLAILGTF